MANAYKCDMCGNFFAYEEGELAYPPMFIRRIKKADDITNNYDLCNFCADRIETLIISSKVKARINGK